MKSRFLSINFHRDTVTRYKQICTVWKHPYSEVLEAMLDFFDRYQLTPFETYHTSIRDSEINIKKRINAVVGILKDIEKNQTQPSVSMLQLLFEQTPAPKQAPKFVEKSLGEQMEDSEYQESLEVIELRNQILTLQGELQETKQDIQVILGSIELQKGFVKQKLLVTLPLDSVELLKQKYS